MSTKQQAKPTTDQDHQRGEQLKAVIGELLLHALGEPADLQRVQVKQLWENHYRVNVVVGVDAVSCRVAHSFFLVVDGTGTIITSTPPICRIC